MAPVPTRAFRSPASEGYQPSLCSRIRWRDRRRRQQAALRDFDRPMSEVGQKPSLAGHSATQSSTKAAPYPSLPMRQITGGGYALGTPLHIDDRTFSKLIALFRGVPTANLRGTERQFAATPQYVRTRHRPPRSVALDPFQTPDAGADVIGFCG